MSSARSTPKEREKLLESIIEFLQKNHISVDIDSYSLHLILDEAITNAMEHGNRWQKEKKVIAKVYQTSPKEIVIAIQDEGIGFNPKVLPPKPTVKEFLNPRGRGIFLLKKLCKKVEWNPIGNEIYLVLSTKNEEEKWQ